MRPQEIRSTELGRVPTPGEKSPLFGVEVEPRSRVVQRLVYRRRRERMWRLAMAFVGVAWTVSIFCLLAAHSSPSHTSSLNASTTLPCNATSRILIIRHCDKDDTSEKHCNAVGFRRAQWFPTLFIGDNARYPPPSKLIARGPEPKHYVMRSVEMVKPLSRASGVPILSNYSDKHVKRLLDDMTAMVEAGELCNKLLVVCWKHEQIPDIVEKLGYSPRNGVSRKKKSGKWKWKAKDFDTVVDLNITLLRKRKKTHKRRQYKWLVQGRIEHENYVDDASKEGDEESRYGS